MGVPARLRGHSGFRIGVVVAGVVVLLLVLAQLLLPVIAVKLVRDRAGRYGTIKSASISAFPAIELLWGKAESASMSAGHLTVSAAQLTELTKQLWQARGVEDATVSAEQATVHLSGLPKGLTVSNVQAEKRGSQISGSATITQQALDEVAPGGFRIQPISSSGGQVEVKANGALFGANISVGAIIKAQEGRLVLEPKGLSLAGFGTLTLLNDPHVKVESVGLELVQRQPTTYKLSLKASLRS
jgi:LmeA-like phospholipid-binding